MTKSAAGEAVRAPGSGTGRARRLRILSLAPTSFFGDYGCHVRILEEARALVALGHDVTVLTYFKGADVPGLRVIRTRPTPWHAGYEVGSSRHKYAFDALLAVRLARVMARARWRGEPYDVIHAHLHEGALIGGLVGRLNGVPVCFDYQGSLTDEMRQHGFLRGNGRRLRFWKAVEAAAERVPDAIVTSTTNAASQVQARWPGKLVAPLHDGVNTAAFHPGVLSPDERAALRSQYGIAAGETVVAFLGLLARHQGIGNILDAAAAARNSHGGLRWLVMGYPNVEAWRREAAARGLEREVVFTGRVPYADAPRMLALGDIAVAPKLSLTEGSGKILNYMAMGLPTVAFDTPAQREYLGELGVYAPIGDSAALAERVVGLALTRSAAAARGRALRAQAEIHTWEGVARRILDVYEGMRCRTWQTT